MPVVLALGGCCRAFDQPRHVARPDDKDAERFLRHFCQLVKRLGLNPDANSKPLEPECPRDTTLDLEAEGVRDLLNAVGFARISSPLLEALAIPSRAPMLIEKRTALIAVAQIALLRPIREGAPRMPHVMSIVFANGFGRVLAVFDSGPQEAVVPPGVIDFGGQRTSASEMRRAILERLGTNDVLVGFHVAWTLTALSLPLPSCRVVDLGAEEAYQLFCFKISDAHSVWKTLFVERLTNSLDRRIPAVFCGDGIELYDKGLHDLIAEAYYTAAIWNVLEPSISAQRLRTSIYRIKCAYSLDNGYALEPNESRLLSKPRSLVDRPHNLPVASLQFDQADIFSMLEVAPVPDLRWNSDHSTFLQHCTNMLREWGP